MSAPAAAAAATAGAPEAPKKGKSKLMIIVAAVVVLAAAGGGGAWFFMNKKAHAAEAAAEAEEKPAEAKHAPTYMPMENMVVNLADDGGDRFCQIGITLELEDDKTAEKIKAILPNVRSRMLMLVSQRSSAELLKRDGKEQLANDIVAEVSSALGYEVEAPAAKPSKKKSDEAAADDEEEAPKKKKKKKAAAPSPVHGVLFSAFIVQ